MSKTAVADASGAGVEVVELKDPIVAAILAWLWPGLGHLYQGRTAKGLLFMICILSTFFYGLFISDGRAVYAWGSMDDWRLPYMCQLCVGLPATPALLQSYLVKHGKDPVLGGLMRPPADSRELDQWYKELHRYLDLGLVYTMIAGLLNVLAIYDAWGGPVRPEAEDEEAGGGADSKPPTSTS